MFGLEESVENLQLLAAIECFIDKSWLSDLNHKRGIFLIIPLKSRLDWLNTAKYDIFSFGFVFFWTKYQYKAVNVEQISRTISLMWVY